VNEKGIFINAISPMTKAKLRLLFEVAPLAWVFQNLLKPHPPPIPLDPSSSSSFLGDKCVHGESLFISASSKFVNQKFQALPFIESVNKNHYLVKTS
jgi:hypothetical protein